VSKAPGFPPPFLALLAAFSSPSEQEFSTAHVLLKAFLEFFNVLNEECTYHVCLCLPVSLRSLFPFEQELQTAGV